MAPPVLVVDDDEGIRRLICLTLESEGYAAREAPDGLVALELLRAAPEPSVVLLDVMMPRLNGIGVLQAVANDPDLARTHQFALLTAIAGETQEAHAALLETLAVRVVAKPFDLETLLEAVERATSRLAP